MHIAKIKNPKTSNQTVVARTKPLNSPRALAFSVFCNTVRTANRFIKLRYLRSHGYLYICLSTCRMVITVSLDLLHRQFSFVEVLACFYRVTCFDSTFLTQCQQQQQALFA